MTRSDYGILALYETPWLSFLVSDSWMIFSLVGTLAMLALVLIALDKGGKHE